MEEPGAIHPLRTQVFSFQLKTSTKPLSKLTNVARKQLYDDYIFLQLEEQKRRAEELSTGVLRETRGRGSFDGKRLAAHYRINLHSMYDIIRQGNFTVDTAAKKRSGRKRTVTPSVVEHIVKQDQLAGGTTLRTLHAVLEETSVPGFETNYKGRVNHIPSISTLAKLKRSNDVAVKKLRLVPMISEQNASERLQ